MSDLKRPLDMEDACEVASAQASSQRVRCPYLDTVNRQILDFDSEKLCCVTLTNMNVYACLVCGKFFQGRGKQTPAYTHSVQAGHFVFMNLHNGKSYCLPDSYEIFDASLRDVEKCLSPEYTFGDIVALNKNASLSRDIHGISYLPGFVGFNNLNSTDYLNVLLHALGHVTPFRDFWLQKKNYEGSKSQLVLQFGLVMRKMWSGGNFKSIVSPQELMQEVSAESKKRFPIGQRVEVLDLMVWLLALLNRELSSTSGAEKKRKTLSPVFEPFQGAVKVTTLTKRLVDNLEEQRLLERLGGDKQPSGPTVSVEGAGDGWVQSSQEVPFNFLSIDIPPNPLFRDSHGGMIIPQVPLFQLLRKFDGSTWTDQLTKEAHLRKQYRLTKLPRYLVLHLGRFTKNNFSLEKNTTIVTFPIKNLELKDYLFSADGVSSSVAQELINACPTAEAVEAMTSEGDLGAIIQKYGSEQQLLELRHMTSNSQLDQATGGKKRKREEVLAELRLLAGQVVERVALFAATKYDLVSSICHDSTQASQNVTVGDLNMTLSEASRAKAAAAKARAATAAAVAAPSTSSSSSTMAPQGSSVLASGSFKINVLNGATGQWFDIQDLRVAETSPQLIGNSFLHSAALSNVCSGVSESYILIYEKQSSGAQSS